MATRKIEEYFRGRKPKALEGGAGKKQRKQYSEGLAKFKTRREGVTTPFLAEKREELASLRRFLSLSSGAVSIKYPERFAVAAINRLPFAYTCDSSHPIIEHLSGKRLTILEAAQAHRVSFYPSYIDFRLDPSHPESQKFLHLLDKWMKNSFPRTSISAIKFQGKIHVEIGAGSKYSSGDIISGREVWGRVRSSREFIKALEEWALLKMSPSWI